MEEKVESEPDDGVRDPTKRELERKILEQRMRHICTNKRGGKTLRYDKTY